MIMKKSITSLLSLVFLSISMVSLAAPWDGSASVPVNDGTTYTISTPEQLAWVAQQSRTNNFAGKTIRLTADLDLGGAQATPQSWEPIGSAAMPFMGELDGASHVLYNFYILSSQLPQGAGLVAETGADAEVHHLAIAQGQIMTDGSSNVGCLVGLNRGAVHHCFNMAQIIAHNGDHVGGLVGANYGSISYAYNTGIITDARTHVGGLVGYNHPSATLNNCYNAGYCKGSDHVGALFGTNLAPVANLTNLKFDQQLTRMYATGDGSNDTIMTNNNLYAVAVSRYSIFDGQSPYFRDAQWYSHARGWYAQLACFKDHPASELSIRTIWLDGENLPIERAEGVGAPKEEYKIRDPFWLDVMPNTFDACQWHSPNQEIIEIASPTAREAKVHRPCGNQEVILTVSCGDFVKQIYTNVKGYDPFDAGKLDGDVSACWNQEDVKLRTSNTGGKEATGGKDDEQYVHTDYEPCYQYMIIRDTVITDAYHHKTYVPIDTFFMPHPTYWEWAMPTDVPGEYSFRRYVHDYQCQTEWMPSKVPVGSNDGRVDLHVRQKFDPGELVEKPDTLYGALPKTIHIASARDASGGGGAFSYTWSLTRKEWIPATEEWRFVQDDTRNPLYVSGALINTPSFDYTFTKPGEYSFTRWASESSCEATPQESWRPHVVVVYAAIDAGKIDSYERALCDPLCTDTIHELDTVSGGNGRYTYRWLCNGVPVPDSDTTELMLENYPMTTGQTYVFTRQAKDNSGLMDWVSSAGAVTIEIYEAYSAGAITPVDEQLCSDALAVSEIPMHLTEQTAPHGEEGSSFRYAWLLFRGGADTLLLDTIRHDAPTLDTTITLSAYGVTLPATLFVQRIVKNTLCEADWKTSANTAMWRFGRSESKQVEVKVCESEIPYSYLYTYADGHTQSFSFSESGQTYTVDDETTEGCPLTVTLTAHVTPQPSVEVRPIGTFCESADTLAVYYDLLGGEPDHWDLTFSDGARAAGFADSLHVPLSGEGVIRIPVPDTLRYGEYALTLTFYADASNSDDCRSTAPQTLSFALAMDGFVHRKDNDVVFVDNSGKHSDDGLTFVAYQWYKNGEPMEGQTGQFYYEYLGLNGFYYVVMTGADGRQYRSCEYEYRPTQDIVHSTNTLRPAQKILRNGQLLLLVGKKMYNALGQEVAL